ncbi:shufflon system plasmid conjugative transfer pilus tip adhesin PilV [Burkholderia cepacia]|uniref:Shufflon system plasmid conjugative transfer pilus tip adhesin PilV n=1 Tax=Burkholderia cepacia TaxID=292 RepID=A0AAX2RIZ9_BURCE|nr:shufflon system plasmid conjugative transfer pilus tip adhesin PilV [Burkholderia cepacia]TES73157.1 shufflon system plasmid conjugative transfer pilus tip adhesin PilV [Burkholderia cepacia]TES99155.1 shufflon system plasmid conjugative transfer pilus tip adhesin PilV [Burkholderia cepacia]TEU40102.1 shufflon system plasmid conjugative transfer pilus tip adhesin PilV [Burkholderia cepacia]TEU46940.1 shufflon system plasmid conjugative transfer pilus tip adhesin PilV [Burkholderia cepacia]T
MSEVLGVLFAILASMMFLPQLQNGVATQRQVMTDVTTAQQQQQWVAAVTNYVNQNISSLQGTVTTSPTVLTVATVKAANVGLPAGFTGTNPFNQTWTAAVTQPTAGNLQVLVYTTGGNAIQDQRLGSIARAAGGFGGMIPVNNSGVYAGGAANAYGAFGAWQIPTAGYGVTGGRPASLLNFTNGTLTNNFLYRNAVPGQPQLNRMNTGIDMNGNDVTNAGNVATNTLTASGKIATNGEDPNDMPPGWGGGVRTWDVYAGGTVAAGAGGGAQPAAYMNYTGQISGRQINSSGDVSANGNLFGANGVVTNGNVTLSSGGTSITNPGRMHINAGENLYLQPWSGGRTVVGGGGGSGQLEVSGRLYADEYVQVNGWAQQGAGCSPNGLIANSGNGPLFCQSGVWTAGGSLSTVQVDSGGWQNQAYAGCPASYTVIGGSCAMTRGGDGRVIQPQICKPQGNGWFCNEQNGGGCIAYAVCGH